MDNGHGTSKASKKVNLLRVSTNSAKTYWLEEKFSSRCLLHLQDNLQLTRLLLSVRLTLNRYRSSLKSWTKKIRVYRAERSGDSLKK